MKYLLKNVFKSVVSLTIGSQRAMYWLANEIDKNTFYLQSAGYLFQTGWTNSINFSRPVDRNNIPIPWLTYPFISFIEERLNKNFNVLEFGSGNSTLYFSHKIEKIVSFENDKKWFQLIQKEIPNNIELHLCKDCRNVKNILSVKKQYFDIILIDGFDRNEATFMSLEYLKNTGILVLDDSERSEYNPTIKLLMQKGYKKIDFWGLAPCINYLKCTSIFYRTQNCLDI